MPDGPLLVNAGQPTRHLVRAEQAVVLEVAIVPCGMQAHAVHEATGIPLRDDATADWIDRYGRPAAGPLLRRQPGTRHQVISLGGGLRPTIAPSTTECLR
jgi:hypothetical protein